MIRRDALCLIALAFGSLACAQQSVQAPALQPPPPARNSGSIALDVMVTDKAGHAIPGLQQQDFTVFDNNQPAQIRSFTAVTPENSADHPTQIFIVIDEVNTDFRAVSTERVQLHQLLTANGGHLPAPVTITLLTESGFKQVAPASQDGNAIDAKLTGQQSSLRAIGRSAGFYGGMDHADISLRALNTLAGALQGEPGRKLVLWMSQGWWLFDGPQVYLTNQQHRQFYEAIVNFSTTLREAGAILYAVDPLGTEDAGSFHTMMWRDFVKPVTNPNRAEPGNVALQVLSSQSGGLVLFGSNDITAEINRCAADAPVWYRIVIDSVRADQPNQWHTLQVKVDKPGMTIRTRNGYYAQP